MIYKEANINYSKEGAEVGYYKATEIYRETRLPAYIIKARRWRAKSSIIDSIESTGQYRRRETSQVDDGDCIRNFLGPGSLKTAFGIEDHYEKLWYTMCLI